MKYVLLQGITNLDKQFLYLRNQNLYRNRSYIVNFYEKNNFNVNCVVFLYNNLSELRCKHRLYRSKYCANYHCDDIHDNIKLSYFLHNTL